MATLKLGERVDARMYECPECSGKTRQYRPVDPTIQPRSFAAQNRVRVDHRPDCGVWAEVQRLHPVLIGMRVEAARV